MVVAASFRGWASGHPCVSTVSRELDDVVDGLVPSESIGAVLVRVWDRSHLRVCARAQGATSRNENVGQMLGKCWASRSNRARDTKKSERLERSS